MDTRADVVRVAYPLFQAGGGGSTPTSALDLLVDRITKEKFLELNRAWHSRLPECGNLFDQRVSIGTWAYGAVFDDIIYAVAWWSGPTARLIDDGKTVELRRMAIGPDAPKNTASRFLAIMTRLIRKEFPHVRKLVSYQDVNVHTGTIYKAAGWIQGRYHRGHERDCPSRRRPPVQKLADKIRWEKSLH